jgi:dihydrolipoamide dehydrogenase
MSQGYDVLVIGGGPGGYVAALRASQLGARVALVEDKFIGGVCLNVGCIPTKALLRSAEVYQLVRDAQTFGVRVDGSVEADWPAMQKRKAQVVRRLTTGVQGLLRRAGVAVLDGGGRFVDARTVEVVNGEGTQRVQAAKVIVATGSRPIRLPLPGFDLPGVLDSTGALALGALPERLLIVGGGVIGAEFAAIFSALGVQVTVVEMLDRMLPMMDVDVSAEIAKSLKRQNVQIYLGSRANGIVPAGEGLRVSVGTPKGEHGFEVDKVLVSVGRRANVEDLGLESVGVRTSGAGVDVNDQMETSAPGVYAVGDVTGQWWLAHVASAQGVVAAENSCGHTAKMNYKSVPSCVFTRPEVASVGLTEAQAREKGYDVLTGQFPFRANGKALTYGDYEGFVKVVSERQYEEVLGVHIVGPHASDLILEGGLALSMEATLDEIEATIHAHPTLGESIAEAALAARGRALHL